MPVIGVWRHASLTSAGHASSSRVTRELCGPYLWRAQHCADAVPELLRRDVLDAVAAVRKLLHETRHHLPQSRSQLSLSSIRARAGHQNYHKMQLRLSNPALCCLYICCLAGPCAAWMLACT